MLRRTFNPYVSRRRDTGWFKPTFDVPETVKQLETWKSKTDVIYFGTERDGLTWHRSAGEEFLSDYEAIVMGWISSKLDQRSSLTSKSTFTGLTTTGSSDSTNTATKSKEETFLTVRSLFCQHPFGVQTAGLDQAGKIHLKLHRSAYLRALQFYVRDVVCDKYKQRLISQYRLLGAKLTWPKIKDTLLKDLIDQPLAHYLQQLVNNLRDNGVAVLVWVESRQALEADLATLWCPDVSEPGSTFRTTCLHFCVRQMSPTEKRILTIPRSSTELEKLTLADLHERCTELSADAFPVFHRSSLRAQGRPLHPDDQPSGGVAPNGTDTGAKPEPAPAETPPVKEPRHKHSFCKSCMERHPWGRHTKARHNDNDNDTNEDDTDTKVDETTTPTAKKPFRRRVRLDDAAGPSPITPKRTDTPVVVRLLANAMTKRKNDGQCMRCGKDGHILSECDKDAPNCGAERAALRLVFSPNA